MSNKTLERGIVTLDIERLAKVLKDELPDLKDPDTRVEIGRIFGIQVVLTGSHYSGWRGRTVYAELTDLERGTVWGAIVREFSPAWWVWMLFGLVIVGLALGGVRYRGRRQKLHNRQADAHYAEAMKHYAAGNLEEARAKGRDALDQNPNHFEASVLIEKIDAALNRPVEPPPEEPGEEETAEDEETVADPPPPPSPPPLTFHVRVWTDNADNPLKQDRLRTRDIKVLPSREESRYKLGDRIIIHFASDRDCHLRPVNIGPTGNVKQLFPERTGIPTTSSERGRFPLCRVPNIAASISGLVLRRGLKPSRPSRAPSRSTCRFGKRRPFRANQNAGHRSHPGPGLEPECPPRGGFLPVFCGGVRGARSG